MTPNLPKNRRPKIAECPAKPAPQLVSAESITIEIPMPPKARHPNARPTRRAEFSAKKRQREEAFIACLGELSNRGMLAPSKRPRWERATIQATFHKPGNRARAADPDGLVSWLKSSIDGIQDAQIVANDSGLRWLPVVELLGAEAGTTPKVVIVITKAE